MPVSRIDVRKVADITIAICSDKRLNDDFVIQEWGDQLIALVEEQKTKKLLVNFERVEFMSSSALRALITLSKKAKIEQTTLFLCGIHENIMEAFRITKLDTVFSIKKSEDEAIRTFTFLS